MHVQEDKSDESSDSLEDEEGITVNQLLFQVNISFPTIQLHSKYLFNWFN